MLEGNDVKAGAEWLQRRKRQRRRGCYNCCCFKAGKRGRSRKEGGRERASEQIAALPVAQGSKGELGLAAGRAQQVRGGRGLGFLFREKGEGTEEVIGGEAARLPPSPAIFDFSEDSVVQAGFFQATDKRLELRSLCAF